MINNISKSFQNIYENLTQPNDISYELLKRGCKIYDKQIIAKCLNEKIKVDSDLIKILHHFR